MSHLASSNEGSVPVPRPDVEWIDIDGEAVLYDPATEVVHRLNPAATAVWKACNGSRSVAEIVRALERAHPEAVDVLARDVQSLIQSLRRLHLLVS